MHILLFACVYTYLLSSSLYILGFQVPHTALPSAPSASVLLLLSKIPLPLFPFCFALPLPALRFLYLSDSAPALRLVSLVPPSPLAVSWSSTLMPLPFASLLPLLVSDEPIPSYSLPTVLCSNGCFSSSFPPYYASLSRPVTDRMSFTILHCNTIPHDPFTL
ncbi:hypothetical protein C8T65DRAFT_116961 [Cerioporus squamosus]|nr:hypothetical protein C8T65DRAFT_116961 [Cerioporus squamosus]